MIEWQKKHGKEGLIIIALTPYSSPTASPMIRKIAEGMGINYKLAQWEKEQSKLPKPLSLVPSYPASLLIDRKGRLRSGVFGPWLMQLDKDLKAALAEKPSKPNSPQGKSESAKTNVPNKQ